MVTACWRRYRGSITRSCSAIGLFQVLRQMPHRPRRGPRFGPELLGRSGWGQTEALGLTEQILTEEECHRVPPRGVRSRMASSWAAIGCKVRSGAAAAIPATKGLSQNNCVMDRAVVVR